MDGLVSSRAFRRWLTPLAALTLLAANGAGHAQDHGAPARQVLSADGSSVLPTFAPSEDPANPAMVSDVLVQTPAATPLGQGVASYYASRFQGRRTASGESFDNGDLTAAHRTLPFGSRVRVINPGTGQSVVVRINDRGPFSSGRTIDLSRAAAEQVGIVRAGHGTVELELLSS